MTGPDYERELGVIEAITSARDQCPSGSVQAVARAALEAVKREGSSVLPTQAFLVLTATRGWSGARAAQVKRSLEAFLERGAQSA